MKTAEKVVARFQAVAGKPINLNNEEMGQLMSAVEEGIKMPTIGGEANQKGNVWQVSYEIRVDEFENRIKQAIQRTTAKNKVSGVAVKVEVEGSHVYVVADIAIK